MATKRNIILFVLGIFSILLFFLLNLALGTIPIPTLDVFRILIGKETSGGEIWNNIIWKSRFPQTITAFIAGAALSISGLQMQTVFRNPLAGPSELGISSGASLGVATLILLSGSISQKALTRMGFIGEMAVSIAAIIGAMAVMVLIILISKKVRGNAILLIMGVMIGYIANAIIGVLKFFSNDEDVRSYVIWGLGSFSRSSLHLRHHHADPNSPLISSHQATQPTPPWRKLCPQLRSQLHQGTQCHHLLFLRPYRHCHRLLRSDRLPRHGSTTPLSHPPTISYWCQR